VRPQRFRKWEDDWVGRGRNNWDDGGITAHGQAASKIAGVFPVFFWAYLARRRNATVAVERRGVWAGWR